MEYHTSRAHGRALRAAWRELVFAYVRALRLDLVLDWMAEARRKGVGDDHDRANE